MDDENDLENDLFEEYDNENFTETTNELQIGDNNADNTEANEAPTREVVPVPKRIIRNPRLKFNADRLCGERGIPVLTKHFKNVKFKGKGHEKEDLNKLLSTLEHWTHRLFPSMKFDACLRQIERLGKKRPVQTCLIKIRRDMPILSSDFVHEEEEDNREEMQNESEFEPPPQDAFDRLFGDSEMEQSNLTSTPTTSHSSGTALGTSFGGSLTEEQRKRMEYNKMLATERRKARMAAQQASKEDENGRHSPSVIDSESAENTSRIAAPMALNLNQQFDSLFGEENVNKPIHVDSEKNPCDSSPSKKDGSEELGLEELMDLVDEEDPSNKLEDNGTPSVRETSDESATQNLDLQFDSMFGEREENKSVPEDSEKDLHRSNFDSKDNEEKSIINSEDKNESILEDSNMNNYESNKDAKDVCESIHEDSENNVCDSTNDDLENISLDEVSEKNQPDSKEDESEELGLDELMDLVDE